MSKLDRLKESINQHRIWLSMLTITDFGLIGWLVLNFETQSFFRVLLATISVILISLLVIALEKKIRKSIENLKPMNEYLVIFAFVVFISAIVYSAIDSMNIGTK